MMSICDLFARGHFDVAWGATLHLAVRHRLTTYDAAYLELAQRRGLPLATLDSELRTAAATEKVPLLGD
jgi:predicted nucleic acid-binding protein